MHRFERAVMVVFRRAATDAAQNGKEVPPVRNPTRRKIPILDFLDLSALEVSHQPARLRFAERQATKSDW